MKFQIILSGTPMADDEFEDIVRTALPMYDVLEARSLEGIRPEVYETAEKKADTFLDDVL